MMCLRFGIVRLIIAALLAAGTILADDTPKPMIVMIDPGHGGEAVGAMSPREQPTKKGAKQPERLQEKNVALQLAKLLGKELEVMGCMVHYTRSTDINVPLHDRAKAANNVGADIFISLHFNSDRSKYARGSEVFFLSLDAVDKELQELADKENEAIENSGKEDFDFDIVASILEDLAQKAYLQESEKLAVNIQNELNFLAGIKERGVKQAPFAVLRTAAMPAVLVETAFISNPGEAAKLRDPAFLKSAAQTIAKGIQRYLESKGNGKTRRKTS